MYANDRQTRIRIPKTLASNLEEIGRQLYGNETDRPKAAAVSELVRRHVVENEEKFDFNGGDQVVYNGD